jgi:hypothetical protein
VTESGEVPAELTERTARLLEEHAMAFAAADQSRLKRVREDAWRLQFELLPLTIRRNGIAAAMLLDVASLSLNYEQAMRNWPRRAPAPHAGP